MDFYKVPKNRPAKRRLMSTSAGGWFSVVRIVGRISVRSWDVLCYAFCGVCEEALSETADCGSFRGALFGGKKGSQNPTHEPYSEPHSGTPLWTHIIRHTLKPISGPL